ncbi:hypothetical protein A2597_00420 [Candidatus Woesebacteria bacterium RIFOXYD1_FULL_46_19]|uniref:Uncharacterized protein n=5 Tax=Candidatus Woeseibacteriota TaxID=1752722 RepID=A0A0G1NPN2_9BACT|nr:MAG: hypothetical protein UX34_C0026G0002 [Candidatus Woesebacteria bacterium GW2011_GWF1_46_13]OGM89006.1 MAG: hypothetical protein A2597_00420 [Candidatus Woesebacteria bacterium RIFOXYD1_FULL_46_19]
MTEERPRYLNGQEQLRVASLVNKLVSLMEKEEIDIPTVVPLAHEAVSALDGKVDFSGGTINFTRYSKGRGARAQAQTDFGQVGAQLNFGENKSEIKIGNPKIYRIGLYVAQKYKHGKKSSLEFHHFMERGSHLTLGMKTELIYLAKNLELTGIVRKFPRARGSGRLILMDYKGETIWGKPIGMFDKHDNWEIFFTK